MGLAGRGTLVSLREGRRRGLLRKTRPVSAEENSPTEKKESTLTPFSPRSVDFPSAERGFPVTGGLLGLREAAQIGKLLKPSLTWATTWPAAS